MAYACLRGALAKGAALPSSTCPPGILQPLSALTRGGNPMQLRLLNLQRLRTHRQHLIAIHLSCPAQIRPVNSAARSAGCPPPKQLPSLASMSFLLTA